MTEIEFAKYAAYLARTCASWSGDSADTASFADNPEVNPDTVVRFANEVRERLLWIERRAYGVDDAAREKREALQPATKPAE